MTNIYRKTGEFELAQANEIWTGRRDAFTELFKEICQVKGWPCDTMHFQKFGRYIGLACVLRDLDGESVSVHSKLRSFLGDLPGIRNPDAPLDTEQNDIVVASEQLDVFLHPMALRTIDELERSR